jgi:hypothetical protein
MALTRMPQKHLNGGQETCFLSNPIYYHFNDLSWANYVYLFYLLSYHMAWVVDIIAERHAVNGS